MHDAFTFIETSGAIDAYRLEANGLQVLLLSEAIAPVTTFMVTYRVGSRDESSGHTGATHFLEHLMFKGTERYNKHSGTSVFEVLQRVGAQINATTSKDRTNYYATLPTEHLGLAVDIEADRMRGALLDERDLEAERTVILNEWDRAQNEPLGNLFRSLWSVAFLAHPYRHPTLGWRSDVETVTASVLRRFYDTFYWPNSATISVIGDFDRAHALSLIAEHFGHIPSSPDALGRPRTREPEQRGERRITLRAPGHLSALMMGYRAPGALHEDADALDILARLLSSGKSSRLWRRLTDNGLTAQVGAAALLGRDPGLFYCMAILAPGRTHEEVEAAIDDAISEVQSEGVTEPEMRRTKNQLRAQEAYARDGTFGIAASLNEAIAAGDWKLYTTYRARLDRVTVEDVRRVAQTYLRGAARTVAWRIGEGNPAPQNS